MPPTGSSSNGSAPKGVLGRLVALLDYHRRCVASIQTTIELLQVDPHDGRRVARTITTAMVLDDLRRDAPAAAAPSGAKRGRPKKQSWKDQMHAQRVESANYLAKFDTNDPRSFPGRGLGSFVRRGYLVKRGDGYVRTSKDYRV
jgi:hypothetical protein